MRINIINRAFLYAIKKANGKPSRLRNELFPVPRPLKHPEPPKRCAKNMAAIYPDDDSYSELDGQLLTSRAESLDLDRLHKEHRFMFKLLVDIERAIDHGDQQQIAVAIKRLRDVMPTDHFMTGNIKLGLERE